MCIRVVVCSLVRPRFALEKILLSLVPNERVDLAHVHACAKWYASCGLFLRNKGTSCCDTFRIVPILEFTHTLINSHHWKPWRTAWVTKWHALLFTASLPFIFVSLPSLLPSTELWYRGYSSVPGWGGWLVDWLTDGLSHWLTDWLIYFLTGWYFGWFRGWMTNWLTDYAADSKTDDFYWLNTRLNEWTNGL